MKHVIDGIELPAFPWAWHQQGDANEHVLLTSGSQWVIAFRTNGEFMPAKEAAIIRHLVASANACAGIPIQDLDRVKDATAPVFEMLMEARKQRDELMASLIGMCGAMQKAMPHLPADHEAIYCGEWFEAAQETIAGVKVGAA